MSGTFSNFNVSLSGMLSAQTGLNITGQNIANVNTEGYTRRLVNLKAGDVAPNIYDNFISSIPNGVQVSDIDRARDAFLDNQFRAQNSTMKFAEVISDIGITMNDILGEPSNSGIASKLNNLFDAASDLSANPELATAKAAFVNAANSLSDTFNQIDAGIDQLTNSIDKIPNGQIDFTLSELNQKIRLFEQINKQVSAQQALNNDVSGLLDERDLLLDQISGIIDIKAEQHPGSNMIELSIRANASEAKVSGTQNFSNFDSAIVPAIDAGTGNNTLVLSLNNGNGTAIGPLTVTFDDNSTARDVVSKINRTFQAAGGTGSIASLNKDNQLVIDSSLMKNARNNTSAEVNIDAGSTALGALGLVAGITNGSDSVKQVIVNEQGVQAKFALAQGADDVSINAASLVLVENNVLQTKIGTIHGATGKIGGFYQAFNVDIPEMRQQLDDLAMSLKTSINELLSLGVTSSGNPGSVLFVGNDAGDFDIDDAVLANPALIAPGDTGAVSDGSIAQEIANLFFGNNTIVSNAATELKTYISAAAATPLQLGMPLVPGQNISVAVAGIVDDASGAGPAVNAGTNGFAGGSLLQIEFLDATGAVVSGPLDFPPSSGPPLDRVTFNGVVPAGAASMRFSINAAFGDANTANNVGHFGISVEQGSNAKAVSENFIEAFASLTGDFGTRANFANKQLDNALALRESINSSRQSLGGVSLEEEAANLLMFQNAFSANARVLSVMDQVLQDILNII